VVSGRVIELAEGWVGIEEACSGLRSLQTVTMLALLLGELFRLRARRRLVLLAGAWGLAAAGNLARTCFLTWVAATEGVAAMEARHDGAGQAVLWGTLAAVAAWAWALTRGEASPTAGAAVPGGGAGEDGGGRRWKRAAFAAFVALAAAEAGTAVWYGRRAEDGARVLWALEPPAGWRRGELPAAARSQLRHEREEVWEGVDAESGARWLAVVLTWEGDPRFSGAAWLHDPRLCLPGVGARLVAELGEVTVEAGGRAVRMAGYRFDTPGGAQRVFFAVWDGRAGAVAEAPSGGVAAERWRRVREGRRGAEVQHLTLVVLGGGDDAAAVTAARAIGARVLRPTGRE
jgi:exosortase/archaeosortase family protein